MSEQNLDIVDQHSQVSAPEQNQGGDVAQSQPAINMDDYLPKSRVNEIVHERTKQVAIKTAEKTRAELQAQYDRERQQNQSSGSMGGMAAPDETKIRQMMQEVFDGRLAEQREIAQKEAFQKSLDSLANDFMGKISAAKETHPDLANRHGEIAELALLVPYINETGEVAGVTQHLLDNDAAFATIKSLVQENPERARRALKKIESSLRENKEATSRQYPNAPLSDVTASAISAGGGSNDIEALKGQAWLRG